jgi:hypothetical protein
MVEGFLVEQKEEQSHIVNRIEHEARFFCNQDTQASLDQVLTLTLEQELLDCSR